MIGVSVEVDIAWAMGRYRPNVADLVFGLWVEVVGYHDKL